MPRPFNLILCGGEHCQTCRAVTGGREWRASTAAAYAVPAGFVESGSGCPHGKPMHDGPAEGTNYAGPVKCRRCNGPHAMRDCPEAMSKVDPAAVLNAPCCE